MMMTTMMVENEKSNKRMRTRNNKLADEVKDRKRENANEEDRTKTAADTKTKNGMAQQRKYRNKSRSRKEKQQHFRIGVLDVLSKHD